MSTLELPSQPPIPFDVEIISNPTQDQLRALALEHTPFCTRTAAGSINKIARNKARMAAFTYIIDRDGDDRAFSHKTIEPAKAAALIERQAAYVAKAGKLIEIDGYVGLGKRAIAVQWLYSPEAANIAGMQQVLSFPREDVEGDAAKTTEFAPHFRLVYTPDLMLEDMPGRQAIIVDLDNYVTYIMGADYFGESKKGALRMLCALHYRNGGLVMHAGAKTVDTGNERLVMGVLGLSGTGKTTTTFSQQGRLAQPVQDDMITIWPQGEISITENGCFAKTYGLTEDSEPIIYRGTVSGDAWIENCFIDEDGRPVFDKGLLSSKEVARLQDVLVATGAPADNVKKYIDGDVTADDVISDGIPHDGWDFVMWSENARSIIPMSAVDGAADLKSLPRLRSLGILNRDEGSDAAVPGIVRFSSPEQAAGYMMLGETSKTSAAGKERGKTRSPFTQPFFPLAHACQAARFSELAATFPGIPMWMMNTGFVGGDGRSVKQGQGLKVKIPHSSAMLEAMLSDSVKWVRDPDFGYEVVDVDAPENEALLAKVPAEVLQPRRWFEANGKKAVYEQWVAEMKAGRRNFLEKFGVETAIIEAVAG